MSYHLFIIQHSPTLNNIIDHSTKLEPNHFLIRIPVIGHVLASLVFRFTRFRKSFLNHPVVFLMNHCQSYTAFLLNIPCLKLPHPYLCSCLSKTIVHLCNLFLLDTSVAQMLLTSRWVSSGVKHLISRRTTPSPNLHLVEEGMFAHSATLISSFFLTGSCG